MAREQAPSFADTRFVATYFDSSSPGVSPEISCESLDLVVRSSHQLLTTLKLVSSDVAVRELGKEFVFGLDFSEIHSYFWPDASHFSQISKALLQSTDLTFTVPVGSSVELLRHLRRLAGSNENTRAHLERLTTEPLTAAIFKYFESAGGGTLSGFAETADQIRRQLQSVAHLSTALQRLRYLESMANLRAFSDFVGPEDRNLEPNQQVLHQAVSSLGLRRPTAPAINNFADAHNYATIWELSRRHYATRNTLYFLVTSSPIPFDVFRHIPWSQFPETSATVSAHGTSLCRHPVQVLYYARALSAGSNVRQVLDQLCRDLELVLNTWRSLETYNAFLERRIPATTPVNLPTSSKYLHAYARFVEQFDNLFGGVVDAMHSDLIAEENIRSLHDVSFFGVGARAAGDVNRPSYSSVRVALSIIDQLSRSTATAIMRVATALKRLPGHLVADVDVRGVIAHNKPRFRKEARLNTDFACKEVRVIEANTGEPCLSADVYSDYYALWWNSRVSFPEFLAQARVLLAGFAAAGIPRPNGSRQNSGIYFYLEGERVAVSPLRIDLEMSPDLDASVLLEVVRGSGATNLQMVRIATDSADLCYDFLPVRGLPQRVGIVSHQCSAAALATYFRYTSTSKLPYPSSLKAVQLFVEELELAT